MKQCYASLCMRYVFHLNRAIISIVLLNEICLPFAVCKHEKSPEAIKLAFLSGLIASNLRMFQYCWLVFLAKAQRGAREKKIDVDFMCSNMFFRSEKDCSQSSYGQIGI